MDELGLFVRVLLVDGDADGIRIAHVAARNTKVIAAPTARLTDVLARPELQRRAVYLFVGNDPIAQAGDIRIRTYVGETDSAPSRGIGGSHQAWDRAEWTTVFFVLPGDPSFNKAHALWVERAFSERIREAGNAEDLTGQTVSSPLDEMDEAHAATVFDDALLLLRVLGLDIFRPSVKTAASPAPSVGRLDGEQELFELKGDGGRAQMERRGNSYIILEGSNAARDVTDSLPPSLKKWREGAQSSGVLTPSASGGPLQFTQPVEFTSPSTAAKVARGTSVSGNEAWRHASTHEKLGDWQRRVTGGGKEPGITDLEKSA